jgi:hypothetical protein
VSPLLKERRHNPTLWLLVLVPVVLVAAKLAPTAHYSRAIKMLKGTRERLSISAQCPLLRRTGRVVIGGITRMTLLDIWAAGSITSARAIAVCYFNPVRVLVLSLG